MIRGPGRREIGHGMLAERSVEPVMPPQEAFPYTVRIISHITESNGSSSSTSSKSWSPIPMIRSIDHFYNLADLSAADLDGILEDAARLKRDPLTEDLRGQLPIVLLGAGAPLQELEALLLEAAQRLATGRALLAETAIVLDHVADRLSQLAARGRRGRGRLPPVGAHAGSSPAPRLPAAEPEATEASTSERRMSSRAARDCSTSPRR